MTTDTTQLTRQRPHLAAPLALYAKWQDFHRQLTPLLRHGAGDNAATGKAYPPQLAGPVIELFATTFGLAETALAPLAKALLDGEVDFLQLPLHREAPPQEGEDAEDLDKVLFFLGRSHLLELRHSAPGDGQEWRDGRCPLCSARAALSTIVEGPRRLLHCSWCATSGPFRYLGCPSCGTTDSEKLGTIFCDEEPGYRVSTCDNCHSYVKVAEEAAVATIGLDLADLVSLPLDIIAQGKGYRRLAPNPIGLVKIS